MRTVFLSSTARELVACREAVYHAVEGLDGYHCVRMEDFGARDDKPTDFCRQTVGGCDLVLCLIGWTYGSRSPNGMSFTQEEYQAACDCKKPLLVLMTADGALAPGVSEVQEFSASQLAFRKSISSERIRGLFTDAADAAVKAVQALRNWENSRAGNATQSRSKVRIKKTAPVESDWIVSAEAVVGIGRSQTNLIHIDDPEVSWEHGQVLRLEGQYRYRHLSQTKPTKVTQRGRQLLLKAGENGEILLRNQDRIAIGSNTLLVEFDVADDGYVPTA